MGCSKRSFKREEYRNKCLLQETISNNLILLLKEQNRRMKPKISPRKDIGSEKKKISKNKSWFFEEIHKIDKLLVKTIKKKSQYNKNRKRRCYKLTQQQHKES